MDLFFLLWALSMAATLGIDILYVFFNPASSGIFWQNIFTAFLTITATGLFSYNLSQELLNLNLSP